jgi:hypothetical protein
LKGNLELLAFVIGILAISIIVGWWAWSAFGFLVADAPTAVKTVRP